MKKLITFLVSIMLVIVMTACSTVQTATQAVSAAVVQNVDAASTTQNSAEATAASTPVVSIEEALAENQEVHKESDADDDLSGAAQITLNGDSISVSGDGVTVNGSSAVITAAGTYVVSGVLADGQISVDAQDEDDVILVLNGVSINNSSSAPIYVVNADEVTIDLADGSINTLSDAASYIFASADVDEPNAALFSAADLTISGTGALTIQANYNDGIASKDGLLITGGVISVSAADDGIRGKDYVVVEGGVLNVTAQGDGIKSDNEEDTTRGYVLIQSGVFNVAAGGDAITAQTDVMVSGGDFVLVSGGGSQAVIDESASAKGIKGVANVIIDAGTFNIDSADDAVHSNGNIAINGGAFTVASGDDGLHADTNIEINGGEINVTNSYEGIESAVITINEGDVTVNASDDGINVAGGNDGSGMNMGPGRGGKMGGGRPGQDAFSTTSSYNLYINGGTIVVEANGDGLDVNGAITMTDGVVIVNGPTSNGNAALDYDAGFSISGGFFVAGGSSGMAQAPGESSSQYSVLINFDTVLQAGTMFHIQDSAGNDILTFSPSKNYQSVVFSSPALTNGETYTIYTGGSSTATSISGLYDGGYTPGNEYTSLTLSSVVTRLGSGGGQFR